MRVVTWNIQHARPNPDGQPDVAAALAVLRSIDADVCALQELDRHRRRSGGVDQPADLAAGLGGQLVFAPTVRRGGEYGIGLVVRGTVHEASVIDLGGTREPRAAVVASVEVAGRIWTVGCTHLSRRRSCAQDQLVTVLDALVGWPGPRVLLGDLNLVPGEVLPWSTAAGYHLVDGPPTHSTRRAQVTRRIDHVLVQGATVERAAVHQCKVSDHRPVAADLT